MSSIEFGERVKGMRHHFLNIGTIAAKNYGRCAAIKNFQISLKKLRI
jgi:hypothetical protein